MCGNITSGEMLTAGSHQGPIHLLYSLCFPLSLSFSTISLNHSLSHTHTHKHMHTTVSTHLGRWKYLMPHNTGCKSHYTQKSKHNTIKNVSYSLVFLLSSYYPINRLHIIGLAAKTTHIVTDTISVHMQMTTIACTLYKVHTETAYYPNENLRPTTTSAHPRSKPTMYSTNGNQNTQGPPQSPSKISPGHTQDIKNFREQLILLTYKISSPLAPPHETATDLMHITNKIITYTNKQAREIATLNNQKTALRQTVQTLQTQLTALQQQIDDLHKLPNIQDINNACSAFENDSRQQLSTAKYVNHPPLHSTITTTQPQRLR
ncbi:uncharacterized protein LOC134083361 isoform X2 [Sardina pilchardus]|uniref:uncharacterized protein LOC134083361 isoform X2 n=1 Tax=Sardina pilchardus TaxID=27697 RepID=UPI002E148E87